MRKLKRNIRALRTIGLAIDIAGVFFGVCILIMGLFIIVDINKNVKLFPLVFLAAFFMNLLIGIKNTIGDKVTKARFQYIISGLLLFVSVIGFIGLWR